MSFALPGFDETLLVADEGGAMTVVHVGARSTKRAVAGTTGAPAVAGRTFENAFHVLLADGKLVTIDPASAAITHSVDTDVELGADLDIESANVAYVTSHSDAVVRKIDPSTGAAVATLDLAAQPGVGQATLGGFLRQGKRLLVQVQRVAAGGRPGTGALAVVEASTLALVKVVDLEVDDPRDPQKKLQGLNPDGPMILEPDHDRVFVTALGQRPSNTGMLLRFDLKTLALDNWVERAQSGFQGPVVLGAPQREMYITYHTSTPVASTHVFHYRLDDAGNPVRQGAGALLDAFEEVPALPSNAAHTLFAFPVSCPAGFCVGGAGISFIATQTAVVAPRLTAAELGLKPAFVLFR